MWIKCLALLSLLVAADSAADGMSFRLVGAETEIRATEQRAIFYKPGAQADWQLHIQPVFDRQAGAAAWVVPFPVRPVVAEGSADFFDQLEMLTSPVFMKICMEGHSDGCFGCAADDKLGGEGTLLGGDALVTVWERDVVGGLDYVLLSATDGDSLAIWLEAEGFQVGPEAVALLSDFETEGVFWFAARLALSADPHKPLPPVRFDLPGIEDPSYPLRLTALGVPAGQTLGLTLWVIHPGNATGWAPVNRDTLGSSPSNRAEFDTAVEVFFSSRPGQLLTLFGGSLWDARDRQVCGEMGTCASYSELGLTVPDTWCPEIQTIIDLDHWITRYEGRLGPDAMSDDLSIARLDEYQGSKVWAERVYYEYTCENEARIDWILLLGVGLGLLARRRRP
jgi:hypothetical protein